MTAYADTGRLTAAKLSNIGQRLAGFPEALMLTAALADRVVAERIPGDMVECGVFSGCHPAVMALTLAAAGSPEVSREFRRVYLLDSFAGIPRGGPRDASDITALVGVGSPTESFGQSVCTEAQVRAHMIEWGVDPAWLCYRPGWFSETAPRLAREIGIKRDGPETWGGISLLRIDGDLYESVHACLTALWPHIREGGFVVLDDYGLSGGRAAIDEYHERVRYEPSYERIRGDDDLVWYRKSAVDSMAARHELARRG